MKKTTKKTTKHPAKKQSKADIIRMYPNKSPTDVSHEAALHGIKISVAYVHNVRWTDAQAKAKKTKAERTKAQAKAPKTTAPKPNKSAIIRLHPHLPNETLIQLAAENGVKLTAKYIDKVRWYDRVTKAEATKAEATKAKVTKAEATKAEATKAEATKAEATKAEATKAKNEKKVVSENAAKTVTPKHENNKANFIRLYPGMSKEMLVCEAKQHGFEITTEYVDNVRFTDKKVRAEWWALKRAAEAAHLREQDARDRQLTLDAQAAKKEATARADALKTEDATEPREPCETHFRECDECRVKPGSPTLCEDCLDRRVHFVESAWCRPPRICSPEAQAIAAKYDAEREIAKKAAAEAAVAREFRDNRWVKPEAPTPTAVTAPAPSASGTSAALYALALDIGIERIAMMLDALREASKQLKATK